MDQMMLALQRANPHAFMGDNINRMKAGVTLKVPERSDIVSMTPREATAETRRQYAEWKAPREVARQEQPAAEPVVDTTTEAAAEAVAETSPEEATTAAAEPATEADVAVTTEAHLQLVAPEDVAVEGAATAGDPGTAVASPDDASTLSQQLALVSEEAEANRAQSQELQSRVDELEQQIVTMKRLLELKNEELASMQQARSESAVEPEPAAEPEAEVVADVDGNAATEEPRGIVNRLMDNPVLAGLGVLVAIVLGGILWVSTRQKNNHGLFDDEMTFNDQLAQDEDTGKAEPVVPVVTDIGEYTEPAPEPPAVSNQQEQAAGDPLTEADVYLAYGRIQQAEDVLQAALQNNPEDNTLRSKLLQVYHQAGNAAAFDSLASDFRGSVSGDDDEWLKIAAMGYELSPGNALYGAAGDAESATEFDMDLSGMEDLLEDVSLAENEPDMKDQLEDVSLTENELPESIEFNLDDIGNETVKIDELEDESEGLLDSSDEVTTKLDLARAYIDMGDPEGARSILSEVMQEGSDDQKREADTIISQLA
jgi:pilus assembly protein FimV